MSVNFNIQTKEVASEKRTSTVYVLTGFHTGDDAFTARAISKTAEHLATVADTLAMEVSELPELTYGKVMDKVLSSGIAFHLLSTYGNETPTPCKEFWGALSEMTEETESQSNPLVHLANWIASFTQGNSEAISHNVSRVVVALELGSEAGDYLRSQLSTKLEKNGVNAEGFIQARKPKSPKAEKKETAEARAYGVSTEA